MPAATPINAIKQSAEFGLSKGGQQFAGLLVFIADVKALGLKTAQGLVLTAIVVLGHDRRQSRLHQALAGGKRPGRFPTMVHAGVYSSVIHYLKTVEALKSDADGRTVVAKMKEMPTDDPLFGKGFDPRRRAQDPRRLSVRGEKA